MGNRGLPSRPGRSVGSGRPGPATSRHPLCPRGLTAQKGRRHLCLPFPRALASVSACSVLGASATSPATAGSTSQRLDWGEGLKRQVPAPTQGEAWETVWGVSYSEAPREQTGSPTQEPRNQGSQGLRENNAACPWMKTTNKAPDGGVTPSHLKQWQPPDMGVPYPPLGQPQALLPHPCRPLARGLAGQTAPLADRRLFSDTFLIPYLIARPSRAAASTSSSPLASACAGAASGVDGHLALPGHLSAGAAGRGAAFTSAMRVSWVFDHHSSAYPVVLNLQTREVP